MKHSSPHMHHTHICSCIIPAKKFTSTKKNFFWKDKPRLYEPIRAWKDYDQARWLSGSGLSEMRAQILGQEPSELGVERNVWATAGNFVGLELGPYRYGWRIVGRYIRASRHLGATGRRLIAVNGRSHGGGGGRRICKGALTTGTSVHSRTPKSQSK